MRALLLGFALLAALPACSQPLKPWSGGAAPALALADLDGRPHRLADYRGQVVLVNFWATWCEPCRAEMPSLERLRRTLDKRPFVILGVDVGEGEAAVRRFAAEVPVGFPLLLDRDGAVARAWRARVLPANFLIGTDGAIHYAHYGELDWSSPALRGVVESLLPRREPIAVLAQVGGSDGVPFITTPDEVVERMLRFAGTGPQDTVADLGSGDGRIVIAAARSFGARGLGIELDAGLVAESRDNARKAGVAERVEFVHGDVLKADISRASVVTIYLLPSLMDRLQPRLLAQLQPGTRIVSHAFGMTGWKPDRSETMRISARHAGQGDLSTLYLWVVPAQVRGAWQGGDWRLRIEQSFQVVEVEGTLAGRPVRFSEATLSGSNISWTSDQGVFKGRLDGKEIRGELAAPGRAAQPLVLRR